MSDDEKCILVAETIKRWPKGEGTRIERRIPDYIRDRNMTILVEIAIAPKYIKEYVEKLLELKPHAEWDDRWWLATASPDARLRAALRAKGIDI